MRLTSHPPDVLPWRLYTISLLNDCIQILLYPSRGPIHQETCSRNDRRDVVVSN